MANVGAYSDVLVVDMVGGLVAGAVAERLGGMFCFSFVLLVNILHSKKEY
jgi:tRNA (adenine-N(1)-)-methyltransferase non-catalytic subunit